MGRGVNLSRIFPHQQWADGVVRDLSEKEARKLVRWWKSKDAKAMWGTDVARGKREALKDAIKRRYGD